MTENDFLLLISNFILAINDGDLPKVQEYVNQLNELRANDFIEEEWVSSIKSYLLKIPFENAEEAYDYVIENLTIIEPSLYEELSWIRKAQKISMMPKHDILEFIQYYLDNPELITKKYQVGHLINLCLQLNRPKILREIRSTFLEGENK